MKIWRVETMKRWKIKLLCNIIRSQTPNARYLTTASTLEDPSLATAKPFESIPSFKILPFIGTSWIYMPMIGFVDVRKQNIAGKQKRKLLGDIFLEKLGPYNMVITYNADDMQTITKNEGSYPSRGTFASLEAYRKSRKQWYSTEGIMVLQGKEWHDLRSKVQKHLMKPKAIQAYLNPMQDVARDFVQKMNKVRDETGEVPDFLRELYKWALESVAFVGLDTRLGCFELNLHSESDGMRMINCVQTLFDCMYKLEAYTNGLQLWKLFPTPTWRRFAKAGDVFTEIAFKHINRSLENLKNGENKDLTLLQCMLLEKGLEASGAMVTVADMLTAGIDTTSHTVGFFLYHMAKNPDKQKVLHDELVQLLPKKEDRITTDVFNELKYLKACLKESLRLNPILGGIVRTLVNDVSLSGYKVPAGTIIIAQLQEMCIEEKYFRNANKFVPERWLNKDETFHRFAYLPFGFGTRSCIGRRLAELEMICLITEILRNFEVQYHHEDIGIETNFVNRPDKPLRFSFVKR